MASFSQHVIASAAVQAAPAQYVVAAPLICFWPRAQVTEEHFAWSEQHGAAVVPTTPHLTGSRNLPVAQVGAAPLHLVATSAQHVGLSVATHVPPAQYVVACAVILSWPASHVKLVHLALMSQQFASVVPTVLYLAVFLYLLARQETAAPLHFCSSSVQHVASSEAVHVVPAQNKVPALHFCFLPAPLHVIVEHLALFTQQLATPLMPAIVLSLAESLYFELPQVTIEALHLRGSLSQHFVLSVAVEQVPIAQSKSAALALCLSPLPQVIVEHFALAVQQADLGSAGLSLFFAVS
jgi:hypothetical protein